MGEKRISGAVAAAAAAASLRHMDTCHDAEEYLCAIQSQSQNYSTSDQV